ncbi:10696_t:CDS:2 [Dentiscutata erythropus]|uniref:10696_t:CDS:1 n=1 Tax=Dentiscutata erythropus TaxID=1348616 RepID=A0A9N9F810_9GLOM|nr:10696_t:CDS:2 [Dentiscutata erythropus]
MLLKIFTSIGFILLTLINHAIAGDPYALPNTTYTTTPSYFDNIQVKFYVFYIYNATPAPAISRVNPIYVFLKDTNDNMANTLQPNIIDLIPGDDGYSDLKRVNVVTGLTNSSGTITSYDSLKNLSNNVKITETDIYVNIPVVGLSAKLENPADGPEMFGYYKGVQFHCFNFGINPAGNATAPIYHVYSSNGTLLATLPSTIPGLSNYTGIWTIYDSTSNVTFPITSFNQVSNLENTYDGTVVNCPISLTSITSTSGPIKKRSRK